MMGKEEISPRRTGIDQPFETGGTGHSNSVMFGTVDRPSTGQSNRSL